MYTNAKEEDFHQNVLKKKFFRDVQALGKKQQHRGGGSRSAAISTNKSEAHRIYTLVDGELTSFDEVNTIKIVPVFELTLA